MSFKSRNVKGHIVIDPYVIQYFSFPEYVIFHKNP